MPSPGDLNLQGDALVALLRGIHPDVTDASILARGVASCMPSILVRPLAGEETVPNSGGCACQTRWGVYLAADVACQEDAQELVNKLASACGEHSIPLRLKPNRKTPTPLYVTVAGESVKLGAAVHLVEPATNFGLIQHNTDGPANAYGAVIPVVIRYDCC